MLYVEQHERPHRGKGDTPSTGKSKLIIYGLIKFSLKQQNRFCLLSYTDMSIIISALCPFSTHCSINTIIRVF